MSAVTKAEITEHLFDSLGLSKSEGKEIVAALFGEINAVLSRGRSVKLSGFGNFVLRDKKERPGLNPKTGEVALVSARRVVTFRAGKKLKNRIAQYANTKAKLPDHEEEQQAQ